MSEANDYEHNQYVELRQRLTNFAESPSQQINTVEDLVPEIINTRNDLALLIAHEGEKLNNPSGFVYTIKKDLTNPNRSISINLTNNSFGATVSPTSQDGYEIMMESVSVGLVFEDFKLPVTEDTILSHTFASGPVGEESGVIYSPFRHPSDPETQQRFLNFYKEVVRGLLDATPLITDDPSLGKQALRITGREPGVVTRIPRQSDLKNDKK